MKKLFICLSLGVALLSSSVLSSADSIVYAGSTVPTGCSISSEDTSSSTEISPRAEKKEWRYRTVDGKFQKRLWSVTYGKWLSEWEWV